MVFMGPVVCVCMNTVCVGGRQGRHRHVAGVCVCVCAVVACFGRCLHVYERQTRLCLCVSVRGEGRVLDWPSGRPAWGHG